MVYILVIHPKGARVLGMASHKKAIQISDRAPMRNVLGGMAILKVWVVSGVKLDHYDFQYIFSRFRATSEEEQKEIEILVPPGLYGTLVDALLGCVDDSKILIRTIPNFIDRMKRLKRCTQIKTLSGEDILRKLGEV